MDSEPSTSSSLPVFAALVAAMVFWITFVVIFLPRILGWGLSLFVNRTAHSTSSIRISTLQLYPLAGRAVAHSIRYTIPDGTFYVEELVLQIRWWRQAPKGTLHHLSVDDTNTLDPLAAETHELDRENAAGFVRRTFFRLKRWWRRTALIKDPVSAEPPPLISFIAVGLRARIVNIQANYQHVNRVLELAKRTKRDGVSSFDIPLTNLHENGSAVRVDSSDASGDMDEAKPFLQRVAESISLRVSSGAFYFCDLGESPLVRVNVGSAKFRYQYGAPACSLDECRKRFRIRLSGLRVCVADRDTVSAIAALGAAREEEESIENNTDGMIKRVNALGFRGIANPHVPVDKLSTEKSQREMAKGSETDSLLREREWRNSFRYGSRQEACEARCKQPLPCTEILFAETAIVDYVFDEPGLHPTLKAESKSTLAEATEGFSEAYTEDPSTCLPPVCKVSILLRGSTFSYDMSAIANVEYVRERLQPAFYDLMPLAMKVQSLDGKRTATGIQIEIDATPVDSSSSREEEVGELALVVLPFNARHSTWETLTVLNVRRWPRKTKRSAEVNSTEMQPLPISGLHIHAKRLSVRTEIPYRIGSQQKTIITAEHVDASTKGVTDIPVCQAKSLRIVRVLNFPQVWNDVHHSTVDVSLSESNTTFLPDTLRVINDLSATIRENSKKPTHVRFFVPSKETVRIQAEQNYKVSLVSSHDNSWEDVNAGRADGYGTLSVSGENGELVLSPSKPTEFLPDATMSSWTLSLPNAVGHLEIPMTRIQIPNDYPAGPINPSRPSDSGKLLHPKYRATLRPQRVRSQHTSQQHQELSSRKTRSDVLTLKVLQFGSLCKLTGRVNTNEVRKFLSSHLPAFLDSVDRSDITFKASSIVFDYNPHHISNILSLIRNYAGGGNHSISTAEKDLLHVRRKEIATSVLDERRYPTARECIILGLGAGQTHASLTNRKAMDELFRMTLHIDQLVMRLHDLPHAYSPFSRTNRSVCSIECSKVFGSLKSSRMGLELRCAPGTKRQLLKLHGGYRELAEDLQVSRGISPSGNLSPPVTMIENFEIWRRSTASPEWGSHFSEFSIIIGTVNGSILDLSAACLTRIVVASVPHQLCEDQAAAAALLSVDNMAIRLGKADVLVISTSSNTFAERSGQFGRLSLLRKTPAKSRATTQSQEPRFLTGVTHLRIPLGLRFCMSNRASNCTASKSRFLIPGIAIDVLMSWGGKSIPWVDDETLRIQVAHAVLVRGGDSRGGFQDGGLLRRAAEMRKITLELALESRPRLWSQAVGELQRKHISRQRQKSRGEAPPWCSSMPASADELQEAIPALEELKSVWWLFLRRSHRAAILKREREGTSPRSGKADSVSIGITTDAVILMSPESLELANDMVLRSTEDARSEEADVGEQKYDISDENESDSVFSSDVRNIWCIYEASRPPDWTLRGKAVANTSFRALETKRLRILLLSPLLPDENRHNDPLLPPKSADDALEVSFPYGLHLLWHSKTEPSSTKVKKDVHGSWGGDVLHTRIFHLSFPEIILGGNEHDFCLLHGLVFISRVKSGIKRAQGHGEQVVDGMATRDDEHSMVCRVKSIDIGRKNSELEIFACFGRISSIFLLMTRALSLENASALSAKNARIEKVCHRILSVSRAELVAMRPAPIRAFFAEISKHCAYNEQTQRGELKGVALRDVLPRFAKADATTLDEEVQSRTVTSIDFSLGSLTLRLANEDMIITDNFVCKGGSTAKAQTSSVLEGHVLHASIGTMALSIRDDIAANTLRMVSDVATFIRRAADRESRPGNALSEPLSYDHINEECMKARIAASLEQFGASRDHRRNTHFPMVMNYGPRKKSRHKWKNRKGTRLTTPRVQVSTHPLSSLGTQAWNTKPFSSKGSAENKPIITSNSQINIRTVRTDSDNRSDGRATENIASSDDIAQFKRLESRQRTRPPSSDHLDQSLFLSREITDGEGLFKENNQYYAYVAIPTAGEVGPPRKRAKSRVRVSTIVPPAFADLEPLSAKPKLQKYVAPATRRNHNSKLQCEEVNTFGRYEQHGHGGSTKQEQITPSADNNNHHIPSSPRLLVPKKRLAVTTFLSCREILCQYFRRKSHPAGSDTKQKRADLRLSIAEPRLTFMSSPSNGSHSFVITATSAELKSTNDDSCILTGSIESMGMKVSIAQSFVPSKPPKVIASTRVSGFKTTLQAMDLRSVLRFRENFKLDLKAVLSAFVTTKTSISEMTRATRLSSSNVPYRGRSSFSTMAFDLLFEDSRIRLQGFHPKDGEMSISYLLDGLFFSIVASEDDKAALTLGIRLYGHGLALSSPSWPADEVIYFPSLDARGVQWGESTGLPTLLKVSAEPLLNCTSIQGLRHVLFTVAGLMAFQDTTQSLTDLAQLLPPAVGASDLREFYTDGRGLSHAAGTTPFSRSFVAWERTKGVRMDLSIRPMSMRLVSGQVVALFQLEAITGIFEWNKLVASGVQLHTAVSIPRIALMFLRMPSTEFSMDEIRPHEHRASMSVALEKSRIDVLKTQEDLTHSFTFRVDIFAVSGQIRPWRLLLDAAVWADEQELVSELQSINYSSLSTPKPRTPLTTHEVEQKDPLEYRIILVGANVQRFKLAVPLLNSEEYTTSRLALRATELHVLARKRFDNQSTPQTHILEVKSHFIGILWENSALFSSHHARITLGMKRSFTDSSALFGAVNITMAAGTWRICPRKDVVMAILEAKNKRENKGETDVTRNTFRPSPSVSPKWKTNTTSDTSSTTTEKQGRPLVESLRFKMLHTSGAIEGLDGDGLIQQSPAGASTSAVENARSTEPSTLTLPAFSVAIVRDESKDFDLVDIDFSDREGGEFPPKCLQKVSNLLTDLFGAVAADTQRSTELAPKAPVQAREMSRDVSVLIRFGKSMYKAQENIVSPVESKFSFFAGRSSTMLLSLTTRPVFGEEIGHTTVMTCISPKLALEITPLIEGSLPQSLRLIDARFHHGVSPCFSPQTLLHVSKVTALLDAKTLLLTKGRLNMQSNPNPVNDISDYMEMAPIKHKLARREVCSRSERGFMIVIGRSKKSFKRSSDPQIRLEPDIRLQLKLPLKNETAANQIDLAVERLHIGFCQTREDPFSAEMLLKVHVALHEANLRGLWDILSCRLRMQENLLHISSSGVSSRDNGSVVITNILNRLNFESRQFDNHTMKLAIDALATIFSVPRRDILLESTTIRTEISHTMVKFVTRMLSQVKKLSGEIRLLLEREVSRESKRNKVAKQIVETDRSADDLLANEQTQKRRESKGRKGHTRSATVGASSLRTVPTIDELLGRTGKRTRVYIKGDELSAVMRGYQFEESRHSAVILLLGYSVNYDYDCTRRPEPIHCRLLSIDYKSMRMTYNDDGRAICSDLFRAPSPKLRLKVTDTDGGLVAELVGDLELKLGSGFFYWRDFKRIVEYTVRGITPAQEVAVNERNATRAERAELWNGRRAQVSVSLNPRIDVIGDLTNDVLQFRAAWMNGLRAVPKHLYDYVAIPLEKFSEVVCDSLSR